MRVLNATPKKERYLEADHQTCAVYSAPSVLRCFFVDAPSRIVAQPAAAPNYLRLDPRCKIDQDRISFSRLERERMIERHFVTPKNTYTKVRTAGRCATPRLSLCKQTTMRMSMFLDAPPDCPTVISPA